jgi:SnoaL-like polyketide cyclase
MLRSMRGAFPDFHLTIEDQIAEGNKVITRVTFRGTHQGDYRGIAPSQSSTRAAVPSSASSATSSRSMAASPARRVMSRCWPSWMRSSAWADGDGFHR